MEKDFNLAVKILEKYIENNKITYRKFENQLFMLKFELKQKERLTNKLNKS